MSWSYLQSYLLLRSESSGGRVDEMKDSFKQFFPTDSNRSSVFMDVLPHLDSNLTSERYTLVPDATQLGQPHQQLDVAACLPMKRRRRPHRLAFLACSKLCFIVPNQQFLNCVCHWLLAGLFFFATLLFDIFSVLHQRLKHKGPRPWPKMFGFVDGVRVVGNEVFFSVCTRPLKPLV